MGLTPACGGVHCLYNTTHLFEVCKFQRYTFAFLLHFSKGCFCFTIFVRPYLAPSLRGGQGHEGISASHLFRAVMKYFAGLLSVYPPIPSLWTVATDFSSPESPKPDGWSTPILRLIFCSNADLSEVSWLRLREMHN